MEIKSIPHAPVSRPFVERLIGTIRREYLERTFFWNTVDLTHKLSEFRDYSNEHRVHRSLGGATPAQHTPAHHHLLPPRLFAMPGASTVVVFSRFQSPLDYEFATDTLQVVDPASQSLPAHSRFKRFGYFF